MQVYRIVTSSDHQTFMTRVNNLLQEGWNLSGGVAITYILAMAGSDFRGAGALFCQAMTKEMKV